MWLKLSSKKPLSNHPITEHKDWEEIPAFKNLPVRLLIAWDGVKENAFIVFLNHRLDVDYKTVPQGEYDAKLKQSGEILARIEKLEAVPSSHLPIPIKEAFRSLLGTSLVRMLHDDPTNATSLITEAVQFVNARNQEIARKWLLLASLFCTAAIVVGSAIAWACRPFLTALMGADTIPFIIATTSGAAGALFSVLTGTTKLQLDPAAGKSIHYIEGVARIIAGLIAAIFIYLALASGVVASRLVHAASLPAEALLCMVAGTTQRWVPTIIKKVEINNIGPPNRT